MTRMEDTIRKALERGDVGTLEDYFADDMEFEIALAVGPPVPGERCGRSASEPPRLSERIGVARAEHAPEIFADGQRIVAFWDERVALRTGVALHSQSTLVVDLRDGVITRLALHHDLSAGCASRGERQRRAAAAVAERARRERAGVAGVR